MASIQVGHTHWFDRARVPTVTRSKIGDAAGAGCEPGLSLSTGCWTTPSARSGCGCRRRCAHADRSTESRRERLLLGHLEQVEKAEADRLRRGPHGVTCGQKVRLEVAAARFPSPHADVQDALGAGAAVGMQRAHSANTDERWQLRLKLRLASRLAGRRIHTCGASPRPSRSTSS
jgi:hypothetical protein